VSGVIAVAAPAADVVIVVLTPKSIATTTAPSTSLVFIR
jgi:hypothetical protein